MNEIEEFKTLKEISTILGLDKSNVRKFINKNGYNLKKARTSTSNNQLAFVLTNSEVDELIELRNKQGYTDIKIVEETEDGFYYIIQLIPELYDKRIKVGFTNNIENRLQSHRTVAPTAILLCSWSCKRKWEFTVTDSITRINCTHIGNEVYDCEDLSILIENANKFFEIMPNKEN